MNLNGAGTLLFLFEKPCKFVGGGKERVWDCWFRRKEDACVGADLEVAQRRALPLVLYHHDIAAVVYAVAHEFAPFVSALYDASIVQVVHASA